MPGDAHSVALERTDALVLVDVQNDFLPAGALAVPGGEGVLEPLRRCVRTFVRAGLPVIATRDWHPPGHVSFASQGGPWPAHCVAGTPGAALPPALSLPGSALLISKGQDPAREAYSGFDGTDLAVRLRALGSKRLFIGGLATDYCVRATVLDALGEGFAVCVLEDAVRAVEVRPGDGERALREMLSHGARRVRTAQVCE